MEDDSDLTTLKSVKMGADNNPSSTSRLVTLQTRKQALEEKIATKNKELRKLCIQEAELTGVMPAEIPLEPGETIPTFRRRVGTAFEYPQNIINSLNNEDETVPALETKIQVQRKIAEAALQLANSSTISKSIRRKNMSLYRQTKQQLEFMEERLENLKIQGHSSSIGQSQQLKQKKKPRPLLEADTISTKSSNPSHNEESNISRSSQSLSQKEPNIETERYIFTNKYNVNYKNSNPYLLEGDIHNANVQNYHLTDDGVASLNKLSSVNYINNDRRSSENPPYPYIHSQSNPNLYQQQQQQQHQQQHMYISNTHTLPHMPQYHQNPAINFPVHAHTLQYPNSRARCHGDEPPRKYEHYRNNGYVHHEPTQQQHHQSPYYNTSSSSSSSHSLHHVQQPYKYGIETSSTSYNNSVNNHHHHILAHQQYETDAGSAGLGGHWIKTETGEMVWCSTMSPHDDAGSGGTWHADKRFGSLDRRKGKHIHHKRTSPNLDGTNKQILRPVINSQQDNIPRPMTLQSVSGSIRSSRHDRQLVRTQSLGSVGAHTVDSVWPSDDNSSYDSDGHSINELNASTRKLKQKGWCETSLDGPVLPSSPQHHQQHQQQHHQHQHQHQQHPAVITEELRSPIQLAPVSPQMHIQQQQQQQQHSPRTPKPILEIPAESNPSPIIETNIEMYNNNVLSELPKNCTVVQAGQCKPYREVTKPFEMSDFYKYSTKFRNQDKGPTTPTTPTAAATPTTPTTPTTAATKNDQIETLNRDVDECQEDVYQKGVYQPLQPMKCQPFTPTNNFNRSFASIGSPDYANTSLDTSLALNQSTSNVAEHFSAEMNAWYQNHGHAHQTRIEIDSNNSSTSPVSMGRSTATLV